MLRSVRLRLAHPPLEDVLIRSAELDDAARAFRLLGQARRDAGKVIRRATSEADAVRRYAAALGYREGLREALAAVLPWMEAYEAHCTHALTSLRAELERRLARSLLEPAAIECVVRTIFDNAPQWHARRVCLYVPSGASHLASDTARWASDAGAARVDIAASTDERLSIECGDDIHIFDTPAFALALSKQALDKSDPGWRASRAILRSIDTEHLRLRELGVWSRAIRALIDRRET